MMLQHNEVEETLARFSPIYLEDMSEVKLLNRIDTKYFIPLHHLGGILEDVQEQYCVLEIEQVRLHRYHTVYYDEPDFMFYQQHHNRYGERYKVRKRDYVDSHLSFFEVKHKTNKKRTIKSRLPLHEYNEIPRCDLTSFIEDHAPTDSSQLEAKLWNDYLRFTLVDSLASERVTIDIGLSFGHEHQIADLPGIVIAEVKQKHFSANSHFIQQMRQHGLRSVSFSKYCAGVYLLYDNVKKNNFKPTMLKVQKMMEQEQYYAGVS